MRLIILTGLASLTALGLTACATTTAAGGAPTAETQPIDDQAATELREHHGHHHHGGVTQFIAMSLDTLGTDDAKRPQVEKLQRDLHACMAPAARLERELHMTLAEGTAAGTIDAAKVDASIARLETATADASDCGADAANRLHAILSPTERSELVEKVLAHQEVWQQVNQEAMPGRERGSRLGELARELSLTPDQVDRIAVALQGAMAGHPGRFDRARVEGRMQAFATAFASDTFDAKTLTADANTRFATHGATRMAIFYETVTPLLTPGQRATLAEHLREHAGHHPAVTAK